MDEQQTLFYRLTPGLEIVPLDEGNILLKSDTIAVRLEGQSAIFFVNQILPRLDGKTSLPKIAADFPELSIDDLKHYLDILVRAQVLHVTHSPRLPESSQEQELAPFLKMLDLLGMPTSIALEKLSKSRVAIFGLEGQGAELADILARSGVGNIILVDPYPLQKENFALIPFLGPDAIGQSRQEVLKTALESQALHAQIEIGPETGVSRNWIASLAPRCDMLVSCFDKGFSTIHHWINQASLESNIPAIYSETKAHIGVVGPLVLPGQTACFMCYRMRSIACSEDTNQAISYEEFLDNQKKPSLQDRAVLPALLPYIASLLALDVLKQLLALSLPSLAGQVLEFDALALHTTTHHVIQEPNCPVCSVKKKILRKQPILTELKQGYSSANLLQNLIPSLVSSKTGIVKRLQRIEKDASEPTRPFVFRAEPANFNFLEKSPGREYDSSGKGMTLEEAQTSAIGEAIEGYSANRWDPEEVIYSRKDDLVGLALDPRLLVLYASNQYSDLPYAPYKDETILGWAHARSLISGNMIWIPASAVFMNYQGKIKSERIFPGTSNGLAVGSTLLEAILKATFEVMERDAFMLAWLHRIPCRRISPWNHPQREVARLCEEYRRRHVELQLYLIPTDHPCYVFAALGVTEDDVDGPAIVAGLGADINPGRAARQALLEVAQVRPVLRRLLRHPEIQLRMETLIADPHLVSTMEDHELLYASQATSKAFEFLQSHPMESFDWGIKNLDSPEIKLQLLVDHFTDQGWDLIFYNLTPPDMDKLGIYAARVVIPGFQPIDFGWKERRLGGDRLYEYPLKMGFATRRTSYLDINPDPHPLA